MNTQCLPASGSTPSLLSMEEDIDTRKINNSFLRDHSYATEGSMAHHG